MKETKEFPNLKHSAELAISSLKEVLQIRNEKDPEIILKFNEMTIKNPKK